MSLFSADEPLRLHGLEFDLAALSEQGPRPENQDAVSIDHFAERGLVAVADGMGGERSGRLAADTALGSLLANGPIRSLDAARRAARGADHAVTRAAEADPAARAGMGCALGLLSLTPAVGDGPGWVGAYVGDVRILSRAPDGTVRLETRDHTPAFARWEAGEIGLDEIPEAEGANRLQRAVGRGGEPDALWLPARPGWSYGIISDGVSKAMRLDELGTALGAPSAAAACEMIRRKVEERGPDDNYTAAVVRVLGGRPVSPAPMVPMEDSTLPNPPPLAAAPAAPRRRGSGSIVVVGLLTLVALAVAAFALWTAWELRGETVPRTELERLQAEVDSLRTRVFELQEPFGPSAGSEPDSAPPASFRPPNQP